MECCAVLLLLLLQCSAIMTISLSLANSCQLCCKVLPLQLTMFKSWLSTFNDAQPYIYNKVLLLLLLLLLLSLLLLLLSVGVLRSCYMVP
jgi:hypothetical protein